MEDEPEIPTEPHATLRCRACGSALPCSSDDLERYMQDDATWPRCCGGRMTVRPPGDEILGPA